MSKEAADDRIFDFAGRVGLNSLSKQTHPTFVAYKLMSLCSTTPGGQTTFPVKRIIRKPDEENSDLLMTNTSIWGKVHTNTLFKPKKILLLQLHYFQQKL